MSDHLSFLYLGVLKKLRFSGQLIQSDPNGQQRILYFSQGGIIYAKGGSHPVRRFHRHLGIYCPWLLSHQERWNFYLSSIDPAEFLGVWEYALLSFWLSRREMTPEQATQIIRSIVIEVLFEVAQAVAVTEQLKHDCCLAQKVELIAVEAAIAEAQQRWQAWQNTKLGKASPNFAPVIRQVESLRQQTSAQMFQLLSRYFNGQHTLYELAWQTQREVAEVAASLQPLVQRRWVELIAIPDLPPPYPEVSLEVPAPVSDDSSTVQIPASTRSALIACVDDSAVIRHTLEKLLTAAGYRFVGVENAQRAIGVLLTHKPDLIFLDLVMPNTNGYEVCQHLRQLSCFQNTPIVMLTGYAGFTSRMHSNFAGASDFLSKPLDAEAVLQVIQKHLHQDKANLSRSSA